MRQDVADLDGEWVIYDTIAKYLIVSKVLLK